MKSRPGGFDVPEGSFGKACTSRHPGEGRDPRKAPLVLLKDWFAHVGRCAVSTHNSRESLLNLAWVPLFMLEACLRHDGMTLKGGKPRHAGGEGCA